MTARLRTPRRKSTERGLALFCARIADTKKGCHVVVLDIRGVSNIADYFVIASGNNAKHVRAMAEEITLRGEKDLGHSVFRVEGLLSGEWVVMDYVDVVVHLFSEPSRRYYNLDRLWGDARIVKKYEDH